MQKQKRQRQPKQLTNPTPQTYIPSPITQTPSTQSYTISGLQSLQNSYYSRQAPDKPIAIHDLFVHPSEMLYVLVDGDGYLRMYDLPTMSLIGRSQARLQGYLVWKCMFVPHDVGMFYTLCRKELDSPDIGLQEPQKPQHHQNIQAQPLYNYNSANDQIYQQNLNSNVLRQSIINTNANTNTITNSNTNQNRTLNPNINANISKGSERLKIRKKIKYSYILNSHYLNKRNEISTSLCPIQLNNAQQNSMQIQMQLSLPKPDRSPKSQLPVSLPPPPPLPSSMSVTTQSHYKQLQNKRIEYLKQYYQQPKQVLKSRQQQQQQIDKLEENKIKEMYGDGSKFGNYMIDRSQMYYNTYANVTNKEHHSQEHSQNQPIMAKLLKQKEQKNIMSQKQQQQKQQKIQQQIKKMQDIRYREIINNNIQRDKQQEYVSQPNRIEAKIANASKVDSIDALNSHQNLGNYVQAVHGALDSIVNINTINVINKDVITHNPALKPAPQLAHDLKIINQNMQNVEKEHIRQRDRQQCIHTIHKQFNPPPISAPASPILQISRYTRTPTPLHPSPNHLTHKYTILCQNGLHICSQSQKLKFIELQNMGIVTGVSVYGNFDWQAQQEGVGLGDMWILFGEKECLFIDLTQRVLQTRYDKGSSKPGQLQYPKIWSQLPLQINKNFYKERQHQFMMSNFGQGKFPPFSQSIGQYDFENPNMNYSNIYGLSSFHNQERRGGMMFNGDSNGGRNCIGLDCYKKLCVVVNVDNQICLISYQKCHLTIIGKVKLDNFLTTFNTNISNILSNPPAPTNAQAYNLYSFLSSSYRKEDNLIYAINFISLLRFGVNTSTTNKYQNKVMLLVAINNVAYEDGARDRDDKDSLMEDQSRLKELEKEKQRQRQRSQKQSKPTCNIHIYSFQLSPSPPPNPPINPMPHSLAQQNPQSSPLPQAHSAQQLITVFRQFPQINKIWYCQYLENKLNYLTYDNQVQMIDLCRLLEGKNIGKEWVNLGYRFEPLEANQQYQQLEDQFELTAEQNGGTNSIRNKINQLNDWSYCLYPRQAVLSRKLKRLNFIDF